jgi:hypothetical protein
VISVKAAEKIPSEINNLIRELGPHSLELCKGFGIPEHMVKAPIYTGYQEYYKTDKTNGEHYANQKRPKF